MVTKKNDNRVEKITLAEKNDIIVENSDENNKVDDNVDNNETEEQIDIDDSEQNLEAVDEPEDTDDDISVDDVYGKDSVENSNVVATSSSDETEEPEDEEIEPTVAPEEAETDDTNTYATLAPTSSASQSSSNSTISVEFYEGEPQITEYEGWKVSMMISSSEGDIRGPEDLTETEAFAIALVKIEQDYGTEFETKEVLMYFFDNGLGSNVRYYYGWIGTSSDETQYMFEVNSTTGSIMSVVKY